MATRHYCDICNTEITNNKFRSELIVVQVKEIIGFIKHQQASQPQITEKRYEFCQTCLSDKLPGFDG